MRYLYLYKCKPNYPVISDAVILFTSAEVPTAVHWPNLLIEGRKLAEQAGCSKAGMEEVVTYLGQIDPCRGFRDLTTLLTITGEY